MVIRFFLFLIGSAFLSSCIQAPTVVSESDGSLIDRAYNFEKTNRPIKITQETIVLDTRNFFDYQLSRLPGALHVDAQEFSLRKVRGDDLQVRATKIARSLALKGVNPFSHVVVLGYGDRGNGDEGVVALTLLILGVERVQIGSMRDFKFISTTQFSPARPNQRYWEPRVVTTLLCPAYAGENPVFMIDVNKRAPMTMAAKLQNMATIYKDWKDFIKKEDFSPNYKIKTELRDEKIDESALILVHGKQAPVVVFSMLQMGYSRACMMDE